MKKKIIYYSILLALLTVAVGFGMYNIVASTNYKNNRVSFKVNNDDAFFQASGTYYYGAVDEPTSTYVGAKYSQEDYYNGVTPEFATWDLGTSEFVYDSTNSKNNVTVLKYIVTIKNINTERILKVDMKGVAVHSDAHFITTISCKLGSNQDQLVFCNDPDSSANLNIYNSNNDYVDITNKQIASGETVQFTISFELNTKTKQFTLDNNVSFELSTIG